MVRSGRFGDEVPGRRADVLGGSSVTQERDESVDLGAQGGSCDTGSALGHDTGHLVRGNDGCPVTPGSVEAVGPSGVPGKFSRGDGGGPYRDDDIAQPGPGLGTRCGLVGRLFGASASVSAYCAHHVHEALTS